MTVYRSRNAITGRLTPARIVALRLPTARRGYRTEDVDALLRRLAYELEWRARQLAEVSAENDRIKRALRTWQSEQARARQESGTGST